MSVVPQIRNRMLPTWVVGRLSSMPRDKPGPRSVGWGTGETNGKRKGDEKETKGGRNGDELDT
eukprot:8011661-Alexandrium_andersonii.AAC.1